MQLTEFLSKNKSELVNKWVESVISTYPKDSCRFFLNETNDFANPVGTTTRKVIEDVFDALLEKTISAEMVKERLEPMIRIRTVQNFTASESLSFIFNIKKIVKQVMGGGYQSLNEKEKSLFENRIDDMALIGFDIYMVCKEKIYQIKADEIRVRTFGALERAGLLAKIPDKETEVF